MEIGKAIKQLRTLRNKYINEIERITSDEVYIILDDGLWDNVFFSVEEPSRRLII